MELIKVGTKINLSEEDREVLEKARDMIRDIFYEVSGDDTLLGYNEEEIGQTYYMLGAIVDAEDRDLVIKE